MKKILAAIIFIMSFSASSAFAKVYYEQNFNGNSFPNEYTKMPRGHEIAIDEMDIIKQL